MFILRPLGAHPNCAGFVRVEGHVPFAGNVFDFVTFSYLFAQNINCVFFGISFTGFVVFSLVRNLSQSPILRELLSLEFGWWQCVARGTLQRQCGVFETRQN